MQVSAHFSVLKGMNLIEQIESKQCAWTVDELASLLQCSPKLLYKLIRRGNLVAYRVGTLLRIDPLEAGRYLRGRTTAPPR
jgi:excisionase family DNA binding protein